MNKRLFLKMSLATLPVLALFSQPVLAEENIHFSSCKEAWANGYSDIHEGEPGYSAKLDRDHDGVACELKNAPKGAFKAKQSTAAQNNTSSATTSGWVKQDGAWYYFDGSGVMSTNWEKVNGTWYYFNTDGAMRTSWQKVNGSWYYMDNSGAMQTDWKEISNAWYYFNADGVMQENRWVGDYYLGSSGAMLVNTKTPDGYRVDASGKWIQDK